MAKRKMTQAQALKEAVRRWGATGRVQKVTCHLIDDLWRRGRQGPLRPNCLWHKSPCPGELPAHKVGTLVMGVMFSIRGTGATWEEAFADADAHKERI